MERPKLTVFTAGPSGSHLDCSYGSLLRQSFEDWEWIVVLAAPIWRPEPGDPRIRLLFDDAGSRTSDAKALACAAALGDIYVELDPGDELCSDALAQVVDLFQARPDVGFVFSDVIQIDGDGYLEPPILECDDSECGEVEVEGKTLLVRRALEPTPHNVSHIEYAPRHVRAFRRSVYEASGGFDATLNAAADHDLVCRLYQRTEFAHVSDCLYRERLSDERSVDTDRPCADMLYERHVQPAALAWARRRGLHCLDLGGSTESPDGYFTVQAGTATRGEFAGDVVSGMDLPDSSVGVIRAVGFLHTISEAEQPSLWEELYRLLTHGGMVLSLTPMGEGVGGSAIYDEDRFRQLTDHTSSTVVLGRRHRFQLSWLRTYCPEDPGEPPIVCANLVALKGGPRQGELHVYT